MNSTQVFAALAMTAVAVLAPARTAAATPNCDGTAAFTHVGYRLNDGPEIGKLSDLTGTVQPGDTLEITSTVRSECADTPHSIVFYGVAEPRFDPDEVQTVITSFTAPSQARIVIPQSDKPGQCRVQIDDITGPVLSQIDRTHRYNEQAIGGKVNRLVLAAGYTTNPNCAPTSPPSTLVEVTTTVPPAVDVPLTEAPTTTAPVPFLPGAPVPSTPEAVVGGDPTPYTNTLPVTGANTWQIVAWGISLTFAGGGFLYGASKCRRRNITTNQENAA